MHYVKTQDLFREVFAASYALIVLTDETGEILGFNPYAEKVTGYEAREVIGRNWFDMFIQDKDKQDVLQVLADIKNGTNAHNGKLNTVICKDGSLRYFEWRNSCIREKPFIFMAMGIDSTEKIDAYMQLEASNTMYQSLVATLPAMVYSYTIGHGGVYFNEEVGRFFGKNFDWMCSNPLHWYHNIHPDDITTVNEAITKLNSDKLYFDIEYRLKNHNGEWRWIRDISYNREETEKRVTISGIALDITEKKDVELRLEAQVKHLVEQKLQNERTIAENSKMASMSELLSSIAHHWRQPLNVLSLELAGIKDFVQTGKGKKEEIMEHIEDAEATIKRLSQLISGYYDITRQKAQDTPQNFNLLDSIREAVEFFISNHKHEISDVKITTSGDDKLSLHGKPTDIFTVMLTLLHNSLDATEKLPLEQRAIEVSIQKERQSVVVSVSDNGQGIPASIKERIFEPYFTTKFPTVGTGMGLYAARIILESKFAGTIEAAQVTKGACMQIRLPL